MKVDEQASKIGTAVLLGCFGVAAMCMIVLIVLSFVVPRALDRAVEAYTDAAPQTTPVPELTESEEEVLHERVDAFGDALEEGSTTEPLVLDEDELNFLLWEAADNEDFEGGFHIELHQNQVSAMVSFPIDRDLDLGPWSRSLRGRYVNGRAIFDVALANGELELNLVSFAVKGHEAPEWMLNIARDMIDESGVLESEDVAEITQKLERIDIEEGRLTISGDSR